MKVTKKMVEAAFGSLEKWSKLVLNPSASTNKAISYCSLCHFSIDREEKLYGIRDLTCKECPIRQITGRKFCSGTPWETLGIFEINNTSIEQIDDFVYQSAEDEEEFYKQNGGERDTIDTIAKTLHKQFELEYNFIAELCLYLIDRYHQGKSVSSKTIPDSLKAAMTAKIEEDSEESEMMRQMLALKYEEDYDDE